MSHNDTFNIKEYSALFYVLIAIMGLYLGYVIGRDHKQDNLNKQQRIEQTKVQPEKRGN